MLAKVVGISLALLVTACAGARTRDIDKLVVGHSQTGELVLASSHYDAMNGLAVADSDLGLEPRQDKSHDLLCSREVPTGSHLPRWTCRYQEDLDKERSLTQDTLSRVVTSAQITRQQNNISSRASPQ